MLLQMALFHSFVWLSLILRLLVGSNKFLILVLHCLVMNPYIMPHPFPHSHQCGAARGMLVPRPGIKPAPLAVEAQTLNHWTAKEVPTPVVFYEEESLVMLVIVVVT